MLVTFCYYSGSLQRCCCVRQTDHLLQAETTPVKHDTRLISDVKRYRSSKQCSSALASEHKPRAAKSIMYKYNNSC